MSAGKAASDPRAAQSGRYEGLKRVLHDYRRGIVTSVRASLSEAREAGEDATGKGLQEGGSLDEVETKHDLEFGLVQLRLETLKRIDEALARLEAGHYGHCAECGDEIPEARLRAVPFAVRCVECQEARESMDRQERDLRRRGAEFGAGAFA